MPNSPSKQTNSRNVIATNNMQVLEREHNQTENKQGIVGGPRGARPGEREADKRRNVGVGNGACDGGMAGAPQHDVGLRLLRDEKGFACRPAASKPLSEEQEERIREFKKTVRHFKHQLECNYAAQTQTMNQTLGHGGFGAVYLVKRKADGRHFALKQVPKRKVLKVSSRERQFAERNFLSSCNCPCIVQLHATFQDELFLYQVVEFLQGGSMMHYMHAKQKFPEDVVKLCIAELVLAVKDVHDKNYIHRDIKPDNIVFTRDGHLKLLDFGLAKFAPHVFHFASYGNSPSRSRCCSSTSAGGAAHAGMSTTTASTMASPHPLEPTCGSNPLSPVKVFGRHLPRNSSSPYGFGEGCCKCLHMQHEEELSGDGNLNRPSDTLLRSICGTPMYTAPEVLRGEGYDHSVDWWSVGVVMFEMLYGGIPFCPPPKYRGDVAAFVKVQVTNHALVCPIPYPSPISSVLSPESISMMQSLVCEPENRFKSAAKIMQHPWFDGIDWETIHRQKSPLCEDTELYAQRHFPLIDVSSDSSDAEQDANTQFGNDAKDSTVLKPGDGGANKKGPSGTSYRSKPGSSAAAEPDLLFSRYEFNRRAVETLPTFSRVLQRNAQKHFNSTFNSRTRDSSASPSPSVKSPGGNESRFWRPDRSSGDHENGANHADVQPMKVMFSPDPKRCELAKDEEPFATEEQACDQALFAEERQHARAEEEGEAEQTQMSLSLDSAEETGMRSFSAESDRGANGKADECSHGGSTESLGRLYEEAHKNCQGTEPQEVAVERS
ncbi:AGC kinase [Toxoplasma gondii ARI]|uniref:non-specific serine/threonine protein kinase n=1 Tax=Toxoplasma gondii ARI TaxID=1074872 RepID=A0A139XI02_TOXGO|nr:AGC kinase [Toxoplasma gondii ARI]